MIIQPQCSGILSRQVQLTDRLWVIDCLVESSSGFMPGQYQSFFGPDGRRLGPFSIASIPSNLPIISFCTRDRLPINPGSQIVFDSPSGSLLAQDQNKNYVFCAGGTGMTPFLSLLKAYENRKNLNCYWSLKDLRDEVLLNYFNISQRVYKHHYLGPEDLDLKSYLEQHIKNKMSVFYLAGPFIFVDKLGTWLLDQGVPVENILSDMKKFF
jgi:NAD(P)H-flavin reductase